MTDGNQIIKTISAHLEHWATTNPDTPAFIFVGEKETERFSRREVYTYGGKMASFLKRVGAMKGDVIAISMCRSLNCPDRLFCELGVQMAGCVSVEAHPLVKQEDALANHLAGSNAKILVIDYGAFSAGNLSSCKTRPYGFDVSLPGFPSLKHVISVPSFKDVVLSEENVFIEHTQPSEVAVLSTTSGTTSLTKLVPQSHEFFINTGKFICQALGDTNNVQYYNDASMNWITGYISCYLATGITRVMRNHTDERVPHPESVLETETKYVGFLSIEEVHKLYLKCKDQMSWKPVFENLILGGQPISTAMIKQALFIAKMVVVIYATTETGPIAYHPVKNLNDYKDFCVGTEFQDVQLKILDDKRREVSTGQIGTIFITRPVMTSGYLNAEGILTRERFTDDGWFVTDDVSYRDESGKLYVTGRGPDVILCGENIIHPQHFERVLVKCPAVDESVLVGIPNPVVNQEICALIKPKPGFEDPIRDVKAFVNDTFLSSEEYEYNIIPKYFVLCDSIFRNANGKILRQKLTEYAMEKLQIRL